ncbi:DUF4112 domain-containing protein [Roseicyclus sp.]|uniref:DUF4112 domain-containing protein n=1 Tax=Roseicyclus sp. TaxID=1914329 RepID=UPI003F9FF331
MAPDATRSAERPDDAEARLARLDRLADMLDSRFSILGIRFGWDGILGLVPGLGDAVTLASGGYMMMEGARLGARRSVLARMAANAGLDFFVGSVPILGDVFDVAFKANRRNIALLRREMARTGRLRAA